MTSSVGARWNGSEFEVGFTAATREEYEGHLEKLAAFADRIWPPDAVAEAPAAGALDETQELIKGIEQHAKSLWAQSTTGTGPVVKKSWANMNAAERQAYRETHGLA
jgi:hypothetical protein